MKRSGFARVANFSQVDIPSASSLAFLGLAGARGNEERYLSRRELRQLFPVSDMTIFRWQRDPDVAFPTPVKLGRNGRNYWWYPSIVEWERRRAAKGASKGRAVR